MKYNGVIQRKFTLYEKIDPQIVYNIISSKLGNFRQFRDEIDRV
jgi:uncharacterized protein YutE (UPF0331/DUF86 family)